MLFSRYMIQRISSKLSKVYLATVVLDYHGDSVNTVNLDTSIF